MNTCEIDFNAAVYPRAQTARKFRVTKPVIYQPDLYRQLGHGCSGMFLWTGGLVFLVRFRNLSNRGNQAFSATREELAVDHELHRQSLRLRLQTNRLMLTQTTSGQLSADDDEFPRSLTIRFLANTPGIVTFLIAEVAPFLLGRYLAKRIRGEIKKADACPPD
jgi:hypothetical protein